MSAWCDFHTENNEFKCCVCLAGAIMRNTLNINSNVDEFFSPKNTSYQHQLLAVDHLRCGNIDNAIKRFYGFDYYDDIKHNVKEKFKVATYANDPIKFKNDMLNIIEYLKTVNL